MIGAAQRVEHYEIAAYGTVRALAQQLGNNKAAQLLEKTLEEEREADEKLNEIAQQIYSTIEEAGEAEGENSASESTGSRRRPKTRTSSSS